MRKGRDGGKKRGEKKREKKREKTDENSGHYVIASSRPLERRTLVPKSVHKQNLSLGCSTQALTLSLSLSQKSFQAESFCLKTCKS